MIVSVSMTEAEAAAFKVLGGSKWLQRQIRATPLWHRLRDENPRFDGYYLVANVGFSGTWFWNYSVLKWKSCRFYDDQGRILAPAKDIFWRELDAPIKDIEEFVKGLVKEQTA